MGKTTLTWEYDGLVGEGFRIYRSDSPMDVNSLPPPLDTVSISEREYTDSSVIEGEVYYYRVSAFAGNVERVSEEIEHTAIAAEGWRLDNAVYDNIKGLITAAGGSGADNQNQVQGLWFKPDGTRLYITRGTGSNQGIYQLDMSTPWDLSTLAYTPGQMVPASQLGTGNSLTFSPDGSKMWHLSGDQYLYYWTLSTPWDITTAVYSGIRLNLSTTNNQCIQFSEDGTKFMFSKFDPPGQIRQYEMSTPWDITTAVQTGSLGFSNPTGIAVKPDGSKIWIGRYVQGSGPSTNRVIVEYEMSTPWDITTAVQTGVQFNYASQVGQLQALVVKPNGSKMYLLENLSKATEGIYQFSVISN